MNQISFTIVVIAVAIISAGSAILGTIVGALVSGTFVYLSQKRALDTELKKEELRLGKGTSEKHHKK